MNGHYNGMTVLLSFLIAAAVSYSALSLANKISRESGKSQRAWLVSGSCVVGVGVWSMHFVGMLSFHMRVAVDYNPLITLLSIAAGITASFIAFRFTTVSEASIRRVIPAGFFMGSAILAMHYFGTAAIKPPILVSYRYQDIPPAILIAYAACYGTLYLFRRARNTPSIHMPMKMLYASMLGLTICGIHYLALEATEFRLDQTNGPQMLDYMAESEPFLLVGVAIATFVLLAISSGVIFFDRNVLERMAYTDSLTSLPNRHHLTRYFESSFPGKESGFLLFIDLDRFKTINDTLGHDAGDLLIKEVAIRLKEASSGDQTVFRLGGDEFLIASAKGREPEASALADVIIAGIKRPYSILGNEIYVTSSIGISLAPEHGMNRTMLLKAADMAMYRAKGAGKNQYKLFDKETDRLLVRKMELERDLRKALVNEELEVYYQPKWDAESNHVSGMEALIRWNHPRLGVVMPSEFIPIAEETGLIVAMTRWMIHEVCRQNTAWQSLDLLHICISVNMSIRVFESGLLGEMVEEALQETGIKPDNLELEITETIAMYDLQDTIKQLKQLKQLGVRISMDDFGTGYSSLGSLDELPIDALKIDRLFIRQSDLTSKQAIISAIITIAGQLNLEVIAEGVETEEQMSFLKSRGCRVMQGYYYGKPMNAKDIEKWLEQPDNSKQIKQIQLSDQ
ncbi:putative bifunctional diguanylate cyclase/phosphodiesterase [Paenibacillus solisilvae]|uniref:Bifunctional diguanylate cyclase/phosphodiesterase n=1 Tax=Paenibacillus solisilvae TaxID=2486751 RepID=A0ABW0W089_9BACL